MYEDSIVPTKTIRSLCWRVLTYNGPKPVNLAIKTVKRLLGVQQLGLIHRVKKANRVEGKREALPADLKAEIAGALRDDVAKLGRLIERDLSHWGV